MPKVTVYKQTGEKSGTTELPAAVFGLEPKDSLIHQALQTQLANKRKSIAHTKTRSERRGGGAKPWRQKGTGRARAGSRRSPIWVGGGVIFGPRVAKNFTKQMNAKARRQAMLMTLSGKLRDKQIVVVDKFDIDKPKTQEIEKCLDKLPTEDNTTLIVMPGEKNDQALKLSARNIPGVGAIRADSLNIRDMLTYEYLLIPRQSIDVIVKTYGRKEVAAKKPATKKKATPKKKVAKKAPAKPRQKPAAKKAQK